MIVPYLKEYLRMLDIDTLPGEAPYIFGPVSDSSRAMTSSAWSAHAKAIIKRCRPPRLEPCSFLGVWTDQSSRTLPLQGPVSPRLRRP